MAIESYIGATILTNPSTPESNSPPVRAAKLKTLIQHALEAGATRASAISTNDISVENNLADMCREPRCKCYGLSTSCPPHVTGPTGFRKLLKNFSRAVFFKIDVPSEILFSSDRREIFQLLHEISSGIERKAVKMGFLNARAYAGGSCKQIFCYDYSDCRVLSENRKCRNPHVARPSMSGFGINVARLIKTARWNKTQMSTNDKVKPTKMTGVYGLVLVY